MSWWKKNVDEDIAEALVAFKLKLNGREVIRDWREDVKIDEDTIQDDLEDIPSILSFWSAALAEAKKKLRTVEYKLDIQKSKIIREIKPPEGVKLTVADKESIINLDKQFAALMIEKIDLECLVSKLFGVVESLRIKSENLRSLMAFRRAEMMNS